MRGKDINPRFDMELIPNALWSRESRIAYWCKDKSVIHVGCCDHIGVIDEKIAAGKWLHGILDSECAFVQGIDSNEEATNYCNSMNLSKLPIVFGDITSCRIANIKEFDYILLGEMIEHVDNPVDFLRNLHTNMSKQKFGGMYIICSPAN